VAADGLCECGCGQPAPISKRSHARLGYVRGEPKRFIRGHANRKPGPDWLEEERGHVTPCWIWQRYVNPSNGYGYLGRKTAHRWTYERFAGRVPRGLEIDHLCRVRCCVNPLHLQAVTRSENTRRGDLMVLLTKLTPQQRYEVMRSREPRPVVAARYGISVHYVTELRAGSRRREMEEERWQRKSRS
jgi:hypothetical protein